MDSTEIKKIDGNSILVTGDIVIDNYLYEGEKFLSGSEEKRPVKSHKEIGGSYLIYKVLDEIKKKCKHDSELDLDKTWSIHFSASLSNNNSQKIHNSFSLWKPYYDNNSKQNYWRMDKALGYGEDSEFKELSSLLQRENINNYVENNSNILVINDGGFHFRKKENSEFWNLSNKINWIVLKATSSLASGDLWYELSEKYSDKLIHIVSAEELRIDGAKIGKGYSWEQTIEDTLDSLYNIPHFQKLLKCKHLIINYSMDGALWFDNGNNRKVTLIYDPSRAEREYEHSFRGKTFGYMSCFTAGIVYNLIQKYTVSNLDLSNGIQTGLSAMRNLIEHGHGFPNKVSPTGFPADIIASQILNSQYTFSRAFIPFTKPIEKDLKEKWMIVELAQHVESSSRKVSLFGLASQIVLKGNIALNNIPHARFGKLVTADRHEIETLRRFRRYMIDYYENKKNNSPISFGIFGPPGAGKSFGVKQIANDIFGPKSWLEFNLSQFNGISELNGAFHQIRDVVLSGLTPIAFWDEFDSKNYFWLQYFLAPMQSGTFQEGQLTHVIGKCIFIFAGATSHSFDSFGEFKKDIGREREFILMKGPDFKSRLDSYYNVLGPNQKLKNSETSEVDSSDTTLYLRRAIFISTKINYNSNQPAEINPGLINALLRTSKYKHGARSFDKLLTLLQSEDHTKLNNSLLPSKNQLSMYVDSDEFEQLMSEKEEVLKVLHVEELAESIHEYYRANRKRKSKSIKEKFNKPFTELAEVDKEDNRAAVRRMQEILSLAGLRILKKEDISKLEEDHKLNIMNHLEYHLELLAEAEHNGWMAQRFKEDWKYGEERNDENKIHPDLVPYNKLPNNIKEIDRESIREYYEKLYSAGYIIDWM